MSTIITSALSVMALAVIANLVVLNVTLFRLLPERLNSLEAKTTQSDSPSTDETTDTCGPGCQQALQFALSQVDQKIATLSNKPSAQSAPVAQRVAFTPRTTKESFIPIGTGMTTSREWEDVAGSDVYINTSNYPNIMETYFEVSMHIPTKNGTMYARLYNVTDKHPVWYSDVSTMESVSTFVSSKISLDQGNKQYRVQIRTTLEYQSLLDTARIKIISN